MRDKMAISAYIFERVEKDPFLGPQIRTKYTFSSWGFRDSI